MSARPRLHVSEGEYLATMTDEKPSLEFVHGVAFQKPLTKKPHADAARRLNRAFLPYEDRRGGCWAWETTTNLSRGTDRRYGVPDLAYWTNGRDPGDNLFNPPTLAIEIRSQGQSMAELRAKCREVPLPRRRRRLAYRPRRPAGRSVRRRARRGVPRA